MNTEFEEIKANKYGYYGPIQTSSSGKVEMYPDQYREQLLKAFFDGMKAQRESMKLCERWR